MFMGCMIQIPKKIHAQSLLNLKARLPQRILRSISVPQNLKEARAGFFQNFSPLRPPKKPKSKPISLKVMSRMFYLKSQNKKRSEHSSESLDDSRSPQKSSKY